MVRLDARSPFDGVLPISTGGPELCEVDLGQLSLIAPFKGQVETTAAALGRLYGISFPDPNRMIDGETACAFWFGLDAAVLTGPRPDPVLSRTAAVTDLTDAWAVAELSGHRARDVLARLTPLDVRETAFEVGQTARTQIGEMSVSLTHAGPDSYLIMVYRSMARSLAHEAGLAIEGVAARFSD